MVIITNNFVTYWKQQQAKRRRKNRELSRTARRALGSFNGIDRRGFQNSLQDVKLYPKKPRLPVK